MLVFFFFKQKTAYEMRISDWSSDVCSSDLLVSRLCEKRLENDISVRVDGPLDHGFTKAPGGTDDDGVGESGFGVDREHDARTGQIRTHHLLDADRKGNVEMIEGFRFTVSDRPVCAQRGEKGPARHLKKRKRVGK